MIMSKKLIPTLQIAQTECGLCCVRTMLEYFNYGVSITELRQILEPGRDGLGTRQLKELLSYFNLDSKIFKIKDIRAFNSLTLPVIAFWKGYHFVCIERVEKNYAIIMDPSVGRIKIDIQEFIKNFSEFIVTASPNEKFFTRKIDITKKYNIKNYFPNNIIGNYIGIIITSILVIMINVIIPLMTQIIVDQFQKNNNFLVYAICSIMILAIFSSAIFYHKSVLSINLMKNFSWHLLNTAFSRILSLPAKYFTLRSPGEIVYRLNSLTRIQDLFGTSFIQLFLDCISMIAILGYVATVSYSLVAIEILFIFLVLIILIKFQGNIQTLSDNELHQASLAQGVQLDAIVSINNIKLGGYKESYIKDWQDKYKNSLEYTARRMNIQQSFISTILSMISGFLPLIILSISLYFYLHGHLSIGQAIAMQNVSTLLFGYVNSIFTTFTNFFMLSRYVDLAEDIYSYPIEKTGKIKLKDIYNDIFIENVWFSYGGSSIYALKNISFKIKQGETIALVGRSGSGKTTLGKIISSLFFPTNGRIYVNGVSFSDYDLESLREKIGYIPQESHLHNRSIVDNLSLGTGMPTEKIIEKCSEFTFLNFINNLPMGYHTQISELGGNLSGGQRQRIQIAKILLQKPQLLVMDEATSSLDNISQQSVYHHLNELHCTKIIIAHRLETIVNADKIIVLDSGEIKQIGAHKELIKNTDGVYAALFNADFIK